MRDEGRFWSAAVARGLVALVVGSGILVIPDMTRTILLLPISVTLSLILFAGYGFLDGGLLFLSSFWTSDPKLRRVTRIQGAASVAVGSLLFTVLFDHARLSWFLWLVAAQAFFTAISEVIVGRHAKAHNIQIWDYSAAAVASVFGIIYVYAGIYFVHQLTYRSISLLVYAFLFAFGVAQCVNAARMLCNCHADSGTIPSA